MCVRGEREEVREKLQTFRTKRCVPKSGASAGRQARQYVRDDDGGISETLNLVIKADVRGSLEALQGALADLGNEEVKVNMVSGGVGGMPRRTLRWR